MSVRDDQLRMAAYEELLDVRAGNPFDIGDLVLLSALAWGPLVRRRK